MSRGLGRIERAILNLIENEGDVHGAEDLAIEIYNSLLPTRAQTGSVLRAAHALARKQPDKIAVISGKGRDSLWIGAPHMLIPGAHQITRRWPFVDERCLTRIVGVSARVTRAPSDASEGVLTEVQRRRLSPRAVLGCRPRQG
jgi:hypothetical protein